MAASLLPAVLKLAIFQVTLNGVEKHGVEMEKLRASSLLTPTRMWTDWSPVAILGREGGGSHMWAYPVTCAFRDLT